MSVVLMLFPLLGITFGIVLFMFGTALTLSNGLGRRGPGEGVGAIFGRIANFTASLASVTFVASAALTAERIWLLSEPVAVVAYASIAVTACCTVYALSRNAKRFDHDRQSNP